MKILLVHNYYGSTAPSGENQVYEAERGMLRAHGHKIFELTRHSDEIRGAGMLGMAKGALATSWNPFAASALRRVVDKVRPDVIHVHNTFPLISPAVFHAAGIQVTKVLTLHNYRLFCAAGIPMRDGKVCTDCLDKHKVLPALQHGCYRNSRLATLPLAAGVALHRRLGTWSSQVDAFIALSGFQRERMIAAGLPEAKMHVKPNFFPGDPEVVPWRQRRDCVVFAGRLSAEKGVMALIQAWLRWGKGAPELRIIGDGDLRPTLERMAEQVPSVPIRFLGQVASSMAQEEIAGARLLILPSECFEGFPMVVREAFAFGTPAAVSDIGPLPSIVQHGVNGLVFKPGDPLSLADVVSEAWNKEGKLEHLSAGARQSFVNLYNEEANYRTLMQIYDQAMGESRRARS